MTTTDMQRPLERRVMRLLCALAGHRYTVARRFSATARQVHCARCLGVWAMEDTTRSLLLWDGDFEDLYADIGVLNGVHGRTVVHRGPVAPSHDPAPDRAHGSAAGGVTAQLPHNT